MPVITKIIPRTETKSKSDAPVVITWKGAPMVRNHSIRSAVHEIVQTSSRLGFVKINIVGASGSGKSSLAETIAHLCHEMAEIPYEVKFMKKEDLVDFNATIKGLSVNHQILVFDELSWLEANFGRKQIDKLKAEITTVRHIDDLADRKIIMILNFHAQKALDKFLRIANFTFYSSCSPEETDYLKDLLGKKYTRKIDLFRRLRIQATGQGRFSFPLGIKNSFTYTAFEPFLPYLFSSGDFCRFVVSPLRTWITQDCQICNPAIQSTKINVDNFIKDYSKKFSKGTAKTAVKIKLFQRGLNVFSPKIVQAMKYIDLYLSNKQINLYELADAYELAPRRTALVQSKKLDYNPKDESEMENES